MRGVKVGLIRPQVPRPSRGALMPQVSSSNSAATTTMPRLLTTKEAADLVRLTVVTLEKYRITGQGPVFVKLGRNVRYDINDLSAWVGRGRCTSTAANTAGGGAQ